MWCGGTGRWVFSKFLCGFTVVRLWCPNGLRDLEILTTQNFDFDFNLMRGLHGSSIERAELDGETL
jgi:hypothetical protein